MIGTAPGAAIKLGFRTLNSNSNAELGVRGAAEADRKSAHLVELAFYSPILQVSPSRRRKPPGGGFRALPVNKCRCTASCMSCSTGNRGHRRKSRD
jgi:hypothetical protein